MITASKAKDVGIFYLESTGTSRDRHRKKHVRCFGDKTRKVSERVWTFFRKGKMKLVVREEGVNDRVSKQKTVQEK